MRKAALVSVVLIESPGGPDGDKKDQDRARWHGDAQVACVCDGLTSSPFSAAAATYVADRAASLFDGTDGSKRIAAHLRRRRRMAASRAFRSQTSVPVAVMKDVIQEKLARSFQTTFAAVRFCGGQIEWKSLGDSEIVIQGADGEIIATNAGARRTGSGGRTDALPDHHSKIASGSAPIRSAAMVVVGSDGFFGAFDDLHRLLGWCASHVSGTSVDDLHERLAAITGDDDISAVIIRLHHSAA